MSSAAGGSLQDKTLNKVALCSAVFAGFAYVGYSYAKTAFCRKLARKPGTYDEEETEVSRVVFRRLSQTTQTDALLGNLDMSTTGKVIIRPKSVQERIRELNLKARQFADTFIAIQTGNGHAGHALSRNSAFHDPKSLQSSPWNSPRLLSPVDVRQLITSRSTENLTQIPPDGSPFRPKWSLKKKKKAEEKADPDGKLRRKKMEAEAITLYNSTKMELTQRLDSLSSRGRVLTPYEARSLVALLYSEDKDIVRKSLVTIANCAAFSVNLDFLREVGCIHRLTTLLNDTDVRLPAVQTLGNVVLSEENIRLAKDCLPSLMSFVQNNQGDDALRLASLVVLTNIATISEWHDEYCPLLHRLYNLVDSSNPHIQLQSLRLLVNLSCNKEMIPSLLAAEGPRKLSTLVVPTTNEALLLRVLTLLATLAQAVSEDDLGPKDLPPEDKAASPDTMYARLFGVSIRDRLVAQTQVLIRSHEDPDIQRQANRLYVALKD
ncbi:armadillo repeat-containing X-linked protein 1-like isoform X2 [Palaemon carinicauda]|uniref:armadillo repeat-containing X-linked protein 1-like isoform X2 n=1 Tax=Palaemon carinicauda TaxID=392227 RepID=UPI0035B5ABFD